MDKYMTITVKAIYEDGVLKPKTPLELEEHTEVKMLVMVRGPDDPTGWKAIDELIGAGKGPPTDASEKHDDYIYRDPHD